MEEIKISIVIPVFNSEKHIIETLLSIKSQTTTYWECILVDDYSTDTSISIIKDFLKNNHGFSLIQKKTERKGANSSRNIGFAASKSNFVVFVDSDDVLDKNFISNRINQLKDVTSTYDVIFFPNYSRFKYNVEEKKVVNNFKNYEDRITIVKDYLLMKEPLPFIVSSGVWRKSSFNNDTVFNEKYSRLQDVEMIVRLLLDGISYNIIDNEPDYYYRFDNEPKNIIKKRQMYIDNSVMLYKDLNEISKKLNAKDRLFILKLIKKFATKTLKTLYLSKQFDYSYFSKISEDFKKVNESISFKSWSNFAFLKKYKISDKPIINSILYRII